LDPVVFLVTLEAERKEVSIVQLHGGYTQELAMLNPHYK
jgi:hypothetical protein